MDIEQQNWRDQEYFYKNREIKTRMTGLQLIEWNPLFRIM